MLRVHQSPTREAVSLDGLWDFHVDHDNTGIEDRLFAGPLPGHREAPVPASVNDLFPDPRIRDHVGYWFFQRTVRVPRGFAGQRTVLRFGSATHHAIVWVNDTEVGRHKGGYLPFEFDITDLVEAGGEFRLTVAVDNRLDYTCIPPGNVVERPDGRREQLYMHDFYNYSGLHRSVHLVSRPERHVSDVTVTTDYEGSTGAVTWRVAQSADGPVRIEVVDRATGSVVATGEGTEGTASISDVTLWTPGVGGLYDLRVSLLDGDQNLIDQYSEPFGVRTVEVSDERLLINGEPFYFTGFGMHEDHETIGKGHSNAHLVQDMELLSWIGANSLRTSHYPYSEEWMDYCDEHGIVVIDETPAVGINIGIAGGILGNDENKPTFSPETINEKTRDHHADVLRELVARDKNRPAVVLWSIANEPESHTDAARDYFEPLAALTRELDPTRPIGFVNFMGAPYDKDRISDLFDVLMLNRYYGWYVNSGDLATARGDFAAELEGWRDAYHKPIIITEYGADTVSGLHSVFDIPFTEDYQVAYLEMNSGVFDDNEAVIGEHVWNFADFQTKAGYARVDGNKKGVFTRDRRPKAAARFLRRRWLGLDGTAVV